MKILINSYPNSGAWQAADMCIWLIMSDTPGDYSQTKNTHHMPEDSDWIIWKHEAIMLIANFENNVDSYFILRDPIESISHNVDRWFSGHVGKVIEGKSIIKEDQIKTGDILNISEKQFIDNQVMIYNSYLNCLELNNKIIKVNYSDLESNPMLFCINILKNSGYDKEKIKTSHINNQFEKYTKTDAYESITEYLRSHPQMEDTYNKYNKLIS